MSIYKNTSSSVLMVPLAFSIVYVCLEMTVRMMDLPDQRLIKDMEKEIMGVDDLEAHFSWETPVYGWDESPVILSSDGDPRDKTPAYTVLFTGKLRAIRGRDGRNQLRPGV